MEGLDCIWKGFGRVWGETLPPIFPDKYAENRVVAERLEGFHSTSCKDSSPRLVVLIASLQDHLKIPSNCSNPSARREEAWHDDR